MAELQKTFNGRDKRVARALNPIEPQIRERIEGRGLYVLRRKGSKEALNVSYSPFGLRWTTDRNRRLLYFKNAELRHKRDIVGNLIPYFHKFGKDGLEKSSSVYVEEYVPIDHYKLDQNGNSTLELDARLQVSEYMMASRALRMVYKTYEDSVRVFSSAEEIEIVEELPDQESF